MKKRSVLGAVERAVDGGVEWEGGGCCGGVSGEGCVGGGEDCSGGVNVWGVEMDVKFSGMVGNHCSIHGSGG